MSEINKVNRNIPVLQSGLAHGSEHPTTTIGIDDYYKERWWLFGVLQLSLCATYRPGDLKYYLDLSAHVAFPADEIPAP